MAQVHEGGRIRHARGLLHVVRHDHDRIILLEVKDEVFDFRGRDRIERRARLVHQEDLRLRRKGARDAEPLLLPTREAHPWLAEIILHLVPQRRLLEAPLNDLVELHAIPDPVQTERRRDVVVHGHRRERIRLLKNHPHATADRDRIVRVDVLVVEEHLTFHPGLRDRLVQPVQTSDERRLAAPRGADDRCRGVFLEVERDVLDRLLRPVPGADFLRSELASHPRILCSWNR